jgi:hypothetical protein
MLFPFGLEGKRRVSEGRRERDRERERERERERTSTTHLAFGYRRW